MLIFQTLFFCVLFLLVKNDYKYKSVELYQLFFLVLLSFSLIPDDYEIITQVISGFVVVGIMFMISFLVEIYIVYIKSKFIKVDIDNLTVLGEGDYPLFFIIGLLFDFKQIIVCLILMGIFFLIYFVFTKERETPLIPSIAYAIITILLTNKIGIL
ncbi:prepilin peptidase [Aliarcobacter butzleri]|uniref:prepilin peptidase n=1 Tax=Aliarcobacter butzleri TaxID=28197 RepID=UPI002B2487FA|nr:hypothetical protein [Aliarcobacter butzleri]